MLMTIKALRWMDKYDEVKRACAIEFMKGLLENGSDAAIDFFGGRR
jgi:hypothetical protein